MSGTTAQAETPATGAPLEAPLNLWARLNPDEQTALTNLFTYQQPNGEAVRQMQAIRECGLALATAIVAYCPRSADRSAALRSIREGIMTANASIVLGGKSLP
jgi:hypothetical protein